MIKVQERVWMDRSQRAKLRNGIVLNLQVYLFCDFCYTEAVLNSWDLHKLGYSDEVANDPDPELLMEELEKKVFRDGWVMPYRNRSIMMCGRCAQEFAKLDEQPAN
jgi:hypothetical protein